MATRHDSATVTLPSDTQILITRCFEAPRTLVWDLMTTPRHLLRWWGPSYMDEMLRGSGHYGPKVDVAAGASTQDRLLAFTGRDPAWCPPATA